MTPTCTSRRCARSRMISCLLFPPYRHRLLVDTIISAPDAVQLPFTPPWHDSGSLRRLHGGGRSAAFCCAAPLLRMFAVNAARTALQYDWRSVWLSLSFLSLRFFVGCTLYALLSAGWGSTFAAQTAWRIATRCSARSRRCCARGRYCGDTCSLLLGS